MRLHRLWERVSFREWIKRIFSGPETKINEIELRKKFITVHGGFMPKVTCFLLLLMFSLMANGASITNYQFSSTLSKLPVDSIKLKGLRLCDPDLKLNENFEGTYNNETGLNLNSEKKWGSTFNSLNLPILHPVCADNFANSSTLGIQYIPSLTDISTMAIDEYPEIFVTAQENVLQIFPVVELEALTYTKSILSQQPFVLGHKFILTWRCSISYQNLDKKRTAIGEKKFDMSYEWNDSMIPAAIFQGRNASHTIKGIWHGSAEWARITPNIPYKRVLAQSIVDAVVEILQANQNVLQEQQKLGSGIVDEDEIDRHWALCVGVSKYGEKSGLPNLPFADKDASDMADLFHEKLNWPKSRIRLLSNEEATSKKVTDNLEKIMSRMRERDLLAIYWSGHVFTKNGRTWLAVNDTEVGGPANGIDLAELRKLLENRKIKNVLFILDICHGGGVPVNGEHDGNAKEVRQSLMPSHGNADEWVFMCVSESNRQAVEGKSLGHGVFTFHLLKGFEGEADGYEGRGKAEGVITLAELRRYLAVRVPAQTEKSSGTAVHPLIDTNSSNQKIWEMNLYED